jgi:hypothetical protein
MMAVAVAARQHIESLHLSILVQLIVMIGAARLMNLLLRRCADIPHAKTGPGHLPGYQGSMPDRHYAGKVADA